MDAAYHVIIITVKPPNKGRIGDSSVVPSREVVLFQRFSLKILKYDISDIKYG